MKCPVSWGGMMWSKSICIILVLGGAYAAPIVSEGVILSFTFIESIFEGMGCGVSFTGISLWIAINTPLLGLLEIEGNPSFLYVL